MIYRTWMREHRWPVRIASIIASLAGIYVLFNAFPSHPWIAFLAGFVVAVILNTALTYGMWWVSTDGHKALVAPLDSRK